MDEESPRSRTQKKKDDRALQRLGEELLNLSSEQLAAIAMPSELAEALAMGRQMTRHGARRRQLQYIGALMRNIDPAPIRKGLDDIHRGSHQKALVFKKLEHWRDSLIEGDGKIVEEILLQCPGAERQRLMQLVRNARKEKQSGKGARASRMLFRYLRDVTDACPLK